MLQGCLPQAEIWDPTKESTMNDFSCTVGNNRLKDDVPLFRIFGLILMIFLGKLEQVDIQPMSS